MDNNAQDPLQIPQEIRTYIEGILDEAGMTGFDENLHQSMINDLYIRLDKFLIGKVAEFMPEEKLEEFAKLSESNPTQGAVTEYIQNNLPNAKEVFSSAFEEFRDLYLEGVKESIKQQEEQNNLPTQAT